LEEMMADYTREQIFFQEILKIFVWLVKKAYGLNLNSAGEVKVMAEYIVKDDNPSVGFKLIVGEVKDAEGQVITDPTELAKLQYEVTPGDDTVIGFAQDATPADGSAVSGQISFGSPGSTGLSYSVKNANGDILAGGGDNLTVTTGDPNSVSSVVGQFDTLTPVEPANPVA
jgi:hypothetical protein